METNDWLDDVLYQTIPSLDRAMLCRQETQAGRETHDFSTAFERKMRRLIRKERRKWSTEKQRMKNRKKSEPVKNLALKNQKLKKLEPEKAHVGGFSFSKRKLIPILLMILLALTATVALAANFRKIVQRFHWYDESQGADCYDFKSNQQIETEDVSWIYPSYMPSGYELAEERKEERSGWLRLDYYDEAGSNISYDMWFLGNRAIYLDAEYDSSETVEISGMSWFVTWRDERYWMARAQKGDILYLVSTPPELPREELIKIMEGIIPPDRDAEEMNMEVEDYEEARKIYFGE